MPVPTAELEAAAVQFRVWLRWYLDKYREDCPSQAELARKLDVNRSTITMQLRPGSTHIPELRTVWAFAALVGFPIDYILKQNPPGVRKGQYGSAK